MARKKKRRGRRSDQSGDLERVSVSTQMPEVAWEGRPASHIRVLAYALDVALRAELTGDRIPKGIVDTERTLRTFHSKYLEAAARKNALKLATVLEGVYREIKAGSLSVEVAAKEITRRVVRDYGIALVSKEEAPGLVLRSGKSGREAVDDLQHIKDLDERLAAHEQRGPTIQELGGARDAATAMASRHFGLGKVGRTLKYCRAGDSNRGVGRLSHRLSPTMWDRFEFVLRLFGFDDDEVQALLALARNFVTSGAMVESPLGRTYGYTESVE